MYPVKRPALPALQQPGAYKTIQGGTQDAFLAKFDGRGKRIWATYFGGTGPENGYSIATDKDGNIYMTGETSISPDLSTGGSYQLTNGGGIDAFLAKFNASGGLLWATYYGGTGADYGRAVTTDKDGNIYLAGITASTNNIATANAHQTVSGGGNDAFLVKFNENGQRIWGTYYGGAGTESGFGIATDTAGNVYLTGLTSSTNNIATPGSFQPAKDAGNDAYLVKFTSGGQRIWATYYGGNNSDIATAITIDKDGSVYIGGNSSSTTAMASAGSFQTTNGGGTDGFIARFNAAGQRVWGSFYGGAGTENGRQLYCSYDGLIYFSGTTDSPTGIATPNGFQPTYGGNTDAFLAKFTKDGNRKWATYFGGAADDVASAAVCDAQGLVCMTGATQSAGLGTTGTQQPLYGGGTQDAFLTYIDERASIVLKAGQCIMPQYYYDASAAAGGHHDFSYNLIAEKLYASDNPPGIGPDSTGFDGKQHATDDVLLQSNTAACAGGDKLSTALQIPATTTCGNASYVTATITINNSSGLIIRNAVMQLSLTGTNSFFASELYGATNDLHFAMPDIFSAQYPSVNYALYNHTGTLRVPLFDIGPGISQIKIDLSCGGNDLALAVFIDSLSAFINTNNKTSTVISTGAITTSVLPVIAGWNAPLSIQPTQSISLNNIYISNAGSIQWVSGTKGILTNTGSVHQPVLQYIPSAGDIANGYIRITLTALNATGCDVSKSANININNVQYDYGDAPASYDLQASKTPVSAASTLLNGLYLGTIEPSSETQAKQSADATGDGREEDGLAQRCPPAPVAGKNYQLFINVTNNSSETAFLSAFTDWNNDGDYLDAGEKNTDTIIVLPQSGLKKYTVGFMIPPGLNTAIDKYFVRLRLSTNAAAIRNPFGPAAEGETEDHLLKINPCDTGICPLYAPNAFTPNNDGANDLFRPKINCSITNYHFTIFNRYGQKVFETTDLNKGWNGAINGYMQSPDTFIWFCQYELNGKSETRKGSMVLIR